MAFEFEFKSHLSDTVGGAVSLPSDLTLSPGAPVLHVDPAETTEGNEVTLSCVARERAAQFIFYKDSEKIGKVNVDATEARLTHRVGSAGNHSFHCLYAVRVDEDTYRSGGSTTVTVSVKGTRGFGPVRFFFFLRMEDLSNSTAVPLITLLCFSAGHRAGPGDYRPAKGLRRRPAFPHVRHQHLSPGPHLRDTEAGHQASQSGAPQSQPQPPGAGQRPSRFYV